MPPQGAPCPRSGAAGGRASSDGGVLIATAGRVSEWLKDAVLAVDLAVGTRGFLNVALDLEVVVSRCRKGVNKALLQADLSFPTKRACFYSSPPRPSGDGGGAGRL